MNNQEILQDIMDLDIEIDRQFRQIEQIYKDLKRDMEVRDSWVRTLSDKLK